MSEKNYLAVLKGGVFASFVILFFMFGSLLFPYIASKQLSFNILIEILFLVWIFFVIKYPKYLPKKSYLTGGLIAYFITILMSLAVSVDFSLTFWGDVERMLGLFHLLHFLLFYFIIITAFRTKKDYVYLLNGVVASSVLVALYAIIKNDADSTIGNRAYVAAMMLFSLFLQVLFLICSKEWWLKILYSIGIIIAFIGFVKADISGSHVGLVAGIFVVFAVLTIVSNNKKLKRISLVSLLAFVVLVIALFSFRSHPVFDGTYMGKALRDFSGENVTLNTRLISYKSAGKYLVDHPVSMIFGVGHGNYALIFDKYFDPKFYDYDRSATYFDRAHSNVVDILTTTGIIGLLAYLSIFVFTVIYLIRAYRKSFSDDKSRSIDKFELALLLGLLTAYFVQNLAVFDSFVTYLYFIILLAFINFIGVKSFAREFRDYKVHFAVRNLLVPVAVILLFLSFNNNVNSFAMLEKTIEAYKISKTQSIIASVDAHKEAFSYKTGLERDARKSFINLFLASSEQILKSDDRQGAELTIALAVEAAEKNVSYNIYDSLALFRLSRVYDIASKFYLNNGNQEKGSELGSLALDALDRSIESSPGRIPPYLTKANLLLNFGQRDEVVATIEYAKNLNPNMAEPYCQLAHFYFVIEDEDLFRENFKICAEIDGLSLINWKDFLISIENRYYTEGELDLLIEFYELIVSARLGDVEILSKLALIYYENNDFYNAKETAKKIINIDPNYQAEVDAFILQLDEIENNPSIE
jgi:O-antigen ligase/tetratricopeptide (TPR) repeat protein